MNKILIFGGTTEGRILADACDKMHIDAILSVATEYGRDILPDFKYVRIQSKRMDASEIAEYIENENITCIIDASHPYAFEVSKNIIYAIKQIKQNILFYRIARANNTVPSEYKNVLSFLGNSQAADYLLNTEGNVLLTTGSKEISAYKKLSSRVFPRVLPSIDSIKLCVDAGIPLKNIIAMQGPFSKELNIAMLRDFKCKYLVTKLSGKTGGVDSKIQAAMELNCTLIVILPKDETVGIDVEECIALLKDKYNKDTNKGGL